MKDNASHDQNGPVWKCEVLDTSGPGPKTQKWLTKVPMGPATPKLALIILKIIFWKGNFCVCLFHFCLELFYVFFFSLIFPIPHNIIPSMFFHRDIFYF